MVDPFMERPLPSFSCCSDTFWDEDASGIPASDLFHFTADINGSNVAITLDKGTRYDFVSSEVVEQLQLVPKTTNPFRLCTNDDELFITHIVFVPLTIHGHKERILCYVLPRAFSCCHLLLGEKWCNRFKVNFDSHYPDIQFFWNYKKD